MCLDSSNYSYPKCWKICFPTPFLFQIKITKWLQQFQLIKNSVWIIEQYILKLHLKCHAISKHPIEALWSTELNTLTISSFSGKSFFLEISPSTLTMSIPRTISSLIKIHYLFLTPHKLTNWILKKVMPQLPVGQTYLGPMLCKMPVMV